MFRFCIVVISMFLILFCPAANAQNTDAMTQAVEVVVVARYVDCETQGKVDFQNPPTAIYQACVWLKGSKYGGKLAVRHLFSEDLSAKTPKNWSFRKSMMPRKNSLWLLYIPNAVPLPGIGFDTYKGIQGRVSCTKAVVESALSTIDRLNCRSQFFNSSWLGPVLQELEFKESGQ